MRSGPARKGAQITLTRFYRLVVFAFETLLLWNRIYTHLLKCIKCIFSLVNSYKQHSCKCYIGQAKEYCQYSRTCVSSYHSLPFEVIVILTLIITNFLFSLVLVLVYAFPSKILYFCLFLILYKWSQAVYIFYYLLFFFHYKDCKFHHIDVYRTIY